MTVFPLEFIISSSLLKEANKLGAIKISGMVFKVSKNGTKHTLNNQSEIFRRLCEILELLRVELREFGAK